MEKTMEADRLLNAGVNWTAFLGASLLATCLISLGSITAAFLF